MRRAIVVMAVFLCTVSGAGAQEADFGNRIQGGPYSARVDVENASCPGTHSVKVTVTGAPWLTLKEPTTVTVAEGETQTVDASINIANTAPGVQTGTITFTCLDCPPPPACKQSVTTIPVTVKVLKAVPKFGDSANDKNFAGLVGGQPVDICVLLQNVINNIAKTAWGAGPRGSKIIKKLNDQYLENNCSDVTFVGTTQTADAKGKPKDVVDNEDEKPAPGNASYVKTARQGLPGVGYIYSEEIYVGVDETLTGIECARAAPQNYYVFTHNGRLGVVAKADLVHTIIHEGLHALNAGQYNVAKPNGGTGASLEEENDGFKAGDEADVAMGLPPTGGSAGKGYNAGSNPSYVPVK